MASEPAHPRVRGSDLCRVYVRRLRCLDSFRGAFEAAAVGLGAATLVESVVLSMVGVVRWLPRCRDRICRRRADEQGKLPDVHLDLHVTHFCFRFSPA